MQLSRADRLSDREAYATLKRLYLERAPEGMSQDEFGSIYGIGTQSMVSQYLNGKTPLTIEAAAKFAKGLGCTIADISPLLATAVRNDVIPFLGPLAKVRRAATIAAVALCFQAAPDPAQATLHKISLQPGGIHIGSRMRRLLAWLFPRPQFAESA